MKKLFSVLMTLLFVSHLQAGLVPLLFKIQDTPAGKSRFLCVLCMTRKDKAADTAHVEVLDALLTEQFKAGVKLAVATIIDERHFVPTPANKLCIKAILSHAVDRIHRHFNDDFKPLFESLHDVVLDAKPHRSPHVSCLPILKEKPGSASEISTSPCVINSAVLQTDSLLEIFIRMIQGNIALSDKWNGLVTDLLHNDTIIVTSTSPDEVCRMFLSGILKSNPQTEVTQRGKISFVDTNAFVFNKTLSKFHAERMIDTTRETDEAIKTHPLFLLARTLTRSIAACPASEGGAAAGAGRA